MAEATAEKHICFYRPGRLNADLACMLPWLRYGNVQCVVVIGFFSSGRELPSRKASSAVLWLPEGLMQQSLHMLRWHFRPVLPFSVDQLRCTP
jgi:hypothetical protein